MLLLCQFPEGWYTVVEALRTEPLEVAECLAGHMRRMMHEIELLSQGAEACPYEGAVAFVQPPSKGRQHIESPSSERDLPYPLTRADAAKPGARASPTSSQNPPKSGQRKRAQLGLREGPLLPSFLSLCPYARSQHSRK